MFLSEAHLTGSPFTSGLPVPVLLVEGKLSPEQTLGTIALEGQVGRGNVRIPMPRLCVLVHVAALIPLVVVDGWEALVFSFPITVKHLAAMKVSWAIEHSRSSKGWALGSELR